MREKELKAITVKELCDRAKISRNAFYQHYRYKEDLFDQMVALATEKVRGSLDPIIADMSQLEPSTIPSYAKHIIEGISEAN